MCLFRICAHGWKLLVFSTRAVHVTFVQQPFGILLRLFYYRHNDCPNRRLALENTATQVLELTHTHTQA